jgi:hypothetical protein
MSTVLGDDEIRKARKKHWCWFCNLIIPIGSTYEYRRGVDCGDFWDMRMHPACNAIAKKEWKEEDYEFNEPAEFRRIYLNDLSPESTNVPRDVEKTESKSASQKQQEALVAHPDTKRLDWLDYSATHIDIAGGKEKYKRIFRGQPNENIREAIDAAMEVEDEK